MDLVLKKVRYKNIFSVGEMPIEIDLKRTSVTVLTGSNGSSKSTVTEAICFSLYGKPLRNIRKPLMVNMKNGKGLLVEIWFDIGIDQFFVKRGIKPDVFEIYKNDKLIPQDAASRDYQSILENDVLRMSYAAFIQTVIVSKTSYTPFMQMPAAKRREFVEGVLGLSIFGEMAKIQSKKIPILKEAEAVAKQAIVLTKSQIVSAEKEIDRLIRIIESNKTVRRDDINKQIDEFRESNVILLEKAKSLKENEKTIDSDAETKYNKFLQLQYKLDHKLADQTKKLTDLSKSNICNECGQDVTPEHAELHRIKYQTEIDKLTPGLADLNIKILEYKILVDNIVEDREHNSQVKSEIQKCAQLKSLNDNQIKTLQSKLDEVSEDDENEITSAKSRLDDLGLVLSQQETTHEGIVDDINYNGIVTQMLKDSGIKSTIINKSMPIINRFINANLSKFGFFVNFELNSEFEETIKSRGIDKLSYFNFSEGEKLRIDMSILLAWREIAAFQNSMTCNVLFLDEMLDASFDLEGSNLLSTMLSELSKTNIFIITHTPEKYDNIARSTIKFKKVDGYSKIVN